MSKDNTVPQLFAFLPDGGAEVGVSDDHASVAVFVDLDTHHEDLMGTHFIELSFAEAVNLSTALLGAISMIANHHEERHLLSKHWEQLREKPLPLRSEQLEADR